MARKKSMISILLGGTSRRKKGFFGTLFSEMNKTQKRNNSHRGVMCGPGGSKKKK